jgi:hypothetical protein
MSTIAVVAFAGGSARMGIYTRDHCPPHATFRDQAGRWIIRITFSFLDANVGLMSIIPPQNSPGPEQLTNWRKLRSRIYPSAGVFGGRISRTTLLPKLKVLVA